MNNLSELKEEVALLERKAEALKKVLELEQQLRLLAPIPQYPTYPTYPQTPWQPWTYEPTTICSGDH